MISETKKPTSSNATPSIDPDEASKRLERALHAALQTNENCIIKAQTGLGKSFTVATTPWRDLPDVTGGEPVIHISQTRNARDEAVKQSEKADIHPLKVENRKELCLVAKGDHDDDLPSIGESSVSEWIDQKCDIEQIPFAAVHKHLPEKLGQELPCSVDGSCKAIRDWDELLRENDGTPKYDVVHATAKFLNISELTTDANIIFDEQPDYQTTFEQENIRYTANELLAEHTDDHYTWEDLLVAIRKQDTEIIRTFQSLLKDHVHNPWYNIEEESNRLTDTILKALSVARPVGNGMVVGSWGRVNIVINRMNTIKSIREVPDLSGARRIIGLDGHPTPLRWKLETGQDFGVREILSTSEDQWWRQRQRRLKVIQVGEDSNSLTKGWRGRTKTNAEAITQAIRERHGRQFKTCICPLEIESDVEQMMESAGIDNPTLLHYNNLKSRNTFKSETVGLVLGRIDLGTDNVLAMMDSLGLDAQTASYEDIQTGYRFDGPEADAAMELLDSVRISSVQQAVGRYAREVRNPDDYATVYVWTNVLPSTWVDERVAGVTRHMTDKIRTVEQAVRESDGPITRPMVEDEADVSKGTAWKVLTWMEEEGIVTRFRGSGPKPDEYRYIDGSLRPRVKLEPE